VVMATLMTVVSAGVVAVRPGTKAANVGPKFLLESVVPKKFGDWTLVPEVGNQVVNPQTKEILDKLYSQVLARTYVNGAGERVMLSIAYGDDQRGDLAAHKPEVCYPAQGFQLLANVAADITTPFGLIPGRRLNTTLGPRKELVTYWFAVGASAVTSKFQQRMIEVKMGMTGQIPDGLLFRVSSIDDLPSRAFGIQDKFVAALLSSVAPADRPRLSGLTPAI
jgi:EpsI family protein